MKETLKQLSTNDSPSGSEWGSLPPLSESPSPDGWLRLPESKWDKTDISKALAEANYTDTTERLKAETGIKGVIGNLMSKVPASFYAEGLSKVETVKKSASDVWSTVRETSANLFKGGREYIIQNVIQARQRKGMRKELASLGQEIFAAAIEREKHSQVIDNQDIRFSYEVKQAEVGFSAEEERLMQLYTRQSQLKKELGF